MKWFEKVKFRDHLRSRWPLEHVSTTLCSLYATRHVSYDVRQTSPSPRLSLFVQLNKSLLNLSLTFHFFPRTEKKKKIVQSGAGWATIKTSYAPHFLLLAHDFIQNVKIHENVSKIKIVLYARAANRKKFLQHSDAWAREERHGGRRGTNPKWLWLFGVNLQQFRFIWFMALSEKTLSAFS